jgi:hypothetical protein
MNGPKKRKKYLLFLFFFWESFGSFFRDALLTLEYRRLALPALANCFLFSNSLLLFFAVRGAARPALGFDPPLGAELPSAF